MKPGPVGWVALRQAQALRDSVVWGIAGLTLPSSEDKLGEWLAYQGLESGQVVAIGNEGKPSLRIYSEVGYAFQEANGGVGLEELAREADCPDPRLEGFGEHRGGATWGDVSNFIITSAFVRLLGAEEQFETDALKALFHYRPQGTVGDTQNLVPVVAEASVILEKPNVETNGRVTYSKPHLWTWLRRQADNRGKRAEIFKKVFDIALIPDGYNQAQKDEWYEKRNKIAHGFEGVTMKLGEYVSVEVFVAKTVVSVCQQCQDKLKVSV